MNTWVLIIVIFAGNLDGGVTVGHVPGFGEKECAIAAAQVTAAHPTARRAAEYSRMIVCVNQGGPKK